MAKLTAEREWLRVRLCAHFRKLCAIERPGRSHRDIATEMRWNEGHFSGLYNFTTPFGLDTAVELHRFFGISLNAIVDTDVEEPQFYPAGWSPEMNPARHSRSAPEPAPRPPPHASSEAHPTRRRSAGAKHRV